MGATPHASASQAPPSRHALAPSLLSTCLLPSLSLTLSPCLSLPPSLSPTCYRTVFQPAWFARALRHYHRVDQPEVTAAAAICLSRGARVRSVSLSLCLSASLPLRPLCLSASLPLPSAVSPSLSVLSVVRFCPLCPNPGSACTAARCNRRSRGRALHAVLHPRTKIKM